MTSISKVRIETEDSPEAHAEWQVNIEVGDLNQRLAYNTLLYAIASLAIDKLGVEYAKWIAGERTRAEYDSFAQKLQEAIVTAAP